MKSNPEVIELDEADLESKLDQIEAALGAEMAEPFRLLLRWYACLLGLLREKKLSIRRLGKCCLELRRNGHRTLYPPAKARTLRAGMQKTHPPALGKLRRRPRTQAAAATARVRRVLGAAAGQAMAEFPRALTRAARKWW